MLNRRTTGTAAAVLLSSLIAWTAAVAQPARTGPMRIVVSTPAGSAPDVVARLLGEQLTKRLGRTVLIDNKVGAGGILAAQNVKASPPDGSTLLMGQAAVAAVTPLTYKQATYDMDRDFETISIVASSPMLFVSNAATGAKSFAEVIAMAKAKPGSVTVGSPSRTSIPHLSGELLGQTTGARFNIVPMSSSGQAVQAIVGGDSQLSVDGAAPLLPLVKSGRLRALAVSSDVPLPGLEGIPLAKDTVPGLVISGWFMIFAPKGTPAAEVQALNTAIDQSVKDPEMARRLQETANYPIGGSVADAKAFLDGERKRWADVIRKAGIEAE